MLVRLPFLESVIFKGEYPDGHDTDVARLPCLRSLGVSCSQRLILPPAGNHRLKQFWAYSTKKGRFEQMHFVWAQAQERGFLFKIGWRHPSMEFQPSSHGSI